MRVWSTQHLPASQQYSYWREVLCEAFTALDCVVPHEHDRKACFSSRVASNTFADLGVSQLQSRAQSVRRGRSEISRRPSEYFFANLQVTGRCLVRQDGREIVAQAGDLYLVDTTRPYEIEQADDDWQSLCCTVPQARLSPLLERPAHELTARHLSRDSGMGRVAADFVQTLADQAVAFDLGQQRVLADNLNTLLAAALQVTAGTDARQADSLRQELYGAMLRYIESHLRDPELQVRQVASHFRVSERYLHKLFEGREHSFTQEVLARRLAHCAQALAQTERARPVASIAFQWGFGDVSHFCRQFKRRYGMSPSAYREEVSRRSAA